VDRNWHVDRNKLKSKSKNTPFNGMELPSVITDVFHNGEQVLQDSQIVEKKSNNNE
jgi:dihydroorotase